MRASVQIADSFLLILQIVSGGYQIGAPDQPHLKDHIMNKDQVKGRIEEAKGAVKEVAGKAVGNKELEIKGKIQNSAGKVQASFGDLKKDLKDASQGK